MPDSASSRASSLSLHSSASEESVAQGVQELNADVINQVVQDDDMVAGNAVKKTLTRRSSDDVESASESMERSRSRRATIVDTIKRTSTFQKISKISWWDTEFKRQRIKVYTTFLKNYLILSLILATVLGIMWGTYYKRDARYHNMKILVVNDDLEVDGITPVVGNTVNLTIQQTSVKAAGGWTLVSHDEFAAQAAKHNNTAREEAKRLVHHQEYWGAIYVHPNITHTLYTAITNNDTLFNVTQTMVEAIYESGRDFISVSGYVVQFLQQFEAVYLKLIREQYSTLINELPSSDDQLTAISFLTAPPTVLYTDLHSVDPILMAPLQLGLTYLVVFTFFQVVMTIRIQIYLSSIVHGAKFLLFKLLFSQLAYLIIAAAYVVLNVAFKVDVTTTFGHSGGLVLWAIAFLTMGSLGALNEIMATLLFTYYPPLIGGWLVLLMALNVAPTSSPLALCSPFYRYGYAMPIHNGYELAKVVFCDAYKGQMGRNFGILVAWIVVTNAALPFVLVHVSKVRARRENQAKEKAAMEESKEQAAA